MESLTYLLILILCLIGSAFFSGSETALLRIRGHELDEDVKEARGPSVLAARELLQSMTRLLVTVLLGNNIVNILGAVVASALAVRYLGDGLGIVVATVVMTITTFLFGEVIPKAYAASHPKRVAYMVALPLYLLHQLLRPLHVIYDRIIDPAIESLAGGKDTAPQASSTEELMRLAHAAAETTPATTADGRPIGIIAAAARAMHLTVADIMVQRTEVVAFSVDTPPDQLLQSVLEEGYTRVPIYEGSIDRVLGIAHLKDLVELDREAKSGAQPDLRRILRPALQVPERKLILQLLTDMQNAFVHFAIVKDEFGVTLGIVTQEDILEELVGEIRDEFDRDELLTIRQVAPGRYQALGRVKVRDFNRQTGWKVPSETDTLAGLIFNTLGRTPRRGESIHLPGYELVVADLSRNRVTQVQVIERPETAAQPA